MLSRKTYFVKERVGFVKLTDAYDIFDPETQQQIGVAKEEPAAWAKYLRLLVNKQLLPTTLNVYQNGDQTPLFSIHRPMTFFRSKIKVTGPGAQPFGYFKSKLFSLVTLISYGNPRGKSMAATWIIGCRPKRI